MEKKHGSGAAGSLGGKGFYIVLFLCAAVIGISVWILFTEAGTNVEDVTTAEEPVEQVSGVSTIMIPAEDTMQAAPEPEVETVTSSQGVESEDTAEAAEDENSETGALEEPEAQEVFSETVTEYIWPVQGSVDRPWSIQTLMYDSTMADWRTHDGLDIACAAGTQVLACAGGTVCRLENDDLLGTTVEIDHGNGVHSVYSNLADQPPVSAGQVMAMGDVIGSVGTTALGEVNQVSHLHFSMTKDGLPVDPAGYMPGEAALE